MKILEIRLPGGDQTKADLYTALVKENLNSAGLSAPEGINVNDREVEKAHINRTTHPVIWALNATSNAFIDMHDNQVTKRGPGTYITETLERFLAHCPSRKIDTLFTDLIVCGLSAPVYCFSERLQQVATSAIPPAINNSIGGTPVPDLTLRQWHAFEGKLDSPYQHFRKKCLIRLAARWAQEADLSATKINPDIGSMIAGALQARPKLIPPSRRLTDQSKPPKGNDPA